jgi:zinc transporter ZupT
MARVVFFCVLIALLFASAFSLEDAKPKRNVFSSLQDEHEHDPIHEIIHMFDVNEDELLQEEEFEELWAVFAGEAANEHNHEHKKRSLTNQMKRSLASVLQTTNETAHCEDVQVVFAELSEASGSLNESTTQAAVNEMFLMRLEGCFAAVTEELPPCGDRVTESWAYGIVSAVGISAISFLGVLLLPLKKGTKTGAILFRILIGFASGSIIGDAVMHILPEVFGVHSHGSTTAATEEEHDHLQEKLEFLIPAVVVCASIVFFFILEKVITKLSGHHHSHGFDSDHEDDEDSHGHKHTRDEEDPEKKHAHSETSSEGDEKKHDHHSDRKEYLRSIKPYGWLNLAADAIHNFTDGLALGAAWATSNSVGLATTLAVLFHEIPQELGDYALLRRAGFTRVHALLFNFASAVTAVIGTIIGLAVGHSEADKWILAVTGGGFLYIGLAELLPELNKEKVKLVWVIEQLAGLMVGFVALFLIAYFETETECIPSAQV